MANTDLNIIINAQNKTQQAISGVSNQLSGFKKNVDKLKPSLQKMALVGSAGFAGLAFGIKDVVDEYIDAEGAVNKFNVVFGEQSEEMRDFIDVLRERMPLATSEIIRMSADLQDLLVPLGLSRVKATEMSQGFLEVSNAIAVFNDVSPASVLEAIKSGLAGSSEPLRQFGVNALESALEARALEEGLLDVGESFADLDPEVKNQIRAQALLAQIIDNSSDAIAGEEENLKGLKVTMLELNATIKEAKVAFGEVFAPILGVLATKLTPLIEKTKEFAEGNKDLTLLVGMLALALTGLVAVLGVVGLLMIALAPISGTVVIAITSIIAIITSAIFIFTWFKNNWEKVWSAVALITTEVVNNVINAVELMVNFVIDGVNKVIDSINSLINKLASIPKIGSKFKGLSIDNIENVSFGRVDNDALASSAVTSGSGTNVVVTGNTFLDEDSAEKTGDLILNKLTSIGSISGFGITGF